MYTKAIELNSSNAIYFCNSKCDRSRGELPRLQTNFGLTCFAVLGSLVFYILEKFEESIRDCDSAISIDPTYVKVSDSQTILYS